MFVSPCAFTVLHAQCVFWSLVYLLVQDSVLALRLKQSSQPGLHHDVGLLCGVI